MSALDEESSDEESVDEGPSEDDIERFSRETAYCPDCGEEVWDLADVCPKCYAYVGGNTSSRSPVQQWFRKRWVALVLILVLIAMVLMMLSVRQASAPDY
jgi:hypothetical protein